VAGDPLEFFEAVGSTGAPRYGLQWFEGTEGIDLRGVGDPAGAPDGPPYSTLRDVDTYEQHVERARKLGTGSNGVFGAKVMWGHLDEAARLAGVEDMDAFIRLLVGDVEPRFVWVRRFDTARAAVSLWRAIQTGAWRKESGAGPGDEPRYDFAAIDHLVQLLRDHDAQWERWFAERGIEPLTFRYRDIASDPIESVRRVLEHLGIDDAPATFGPRLERQADERNELWVERYNEEAGETERTPS
jgi:LPS sulfotransferase NodH